MSDCQRCLEELCDDLREERNAFLQAPTITAVRETNPEGQHNSLCGVTLDMRLTSSYVDQVGKEAAQSLGVLCPFLNMSSGLSIRTRSWCTSSLFIP
jgi:hypothetical protein